jgi:hypothetical protein
MQEPQQIQRGLGSLQDPRQNYGLGKLVKKALRGVKKVVKSPLGKAAIIGGLGMWGMGAGPFSGMKGAGWLKALGAKSMIGSGPLHGTAAGKGWLGKMAGGVGNWWGGLSGGQKLFTGLAGASLAAPFLMKGDEEEEVDEESWTNVPSSIADIRNQAKNYYKVGSAGSNLNFMPQKQFVNANYYAADGGRVGLLGGGEAGQEQIEQMLMAEYVKYKNQGGTLTFEQFVQAIMQQQQEQQGGGMEQPQELPQEGEVRYAANGGRIGFAKAGLANLGPKQSMDQTENKWISQVSPTKEVDTMNRIYEEYGNEGFQAYLDRNPELNEKYLFLKGMDGELSIIPNSDYMDRENIMVIPSDGGNQIEILNDMMFKEKKAKGGRIGAYTGGLLNDDEDETTYNPYAATKMYKRIGKQEGGIMESEVAEEMIDMNGQEKDYRETGGFVNLGGKERADDVPARLSKNEFVFTADAVRAAGGGDIDAGSEVMQNMMDNLEQGGEISEESQGLEGAQAMYDQQQMLQSRIA